MDVLIRPLVEAHGVSGLEPPGRALPFTFGIAAKVGRVIVLGDGHLDVEVPLQILLDQLDLGRHLGEVLVVEERRLEPVRISRLRQELLRFRWTMLPVRAEVSGGGKVVLEIEIRNPPAENGMSFIERVHVLLPVDGHRDGPAHPDVVEGRLVLSQGQAERREDRGHLLDDRRRIRLEHGFHVGEALEPQDIALPSPEGRPARGRIGGREDAVLVEVWIALVKIVRVADEDHFDLAVVLLQDEGPRADHALLEIAVFFQHLTREDDGHGLRHVLREHGIRRLEMHANGVPVGDRHALDFLERERLHPLLRIGLVAVLDVVGDKLPPVERGHVVPSHALT